MIVFVYDGSFEGLLTAIYEAFYSGKKPDSILCSDNLQCNLLDEYIFINTDTKKSDKVYKSIYQKISRETLWHTYNVFLSEEHDVGTLIYNYLTLGWKLGSKVNLNLSDDRVLEVHSLSQKVGFEKHRMLGFVRFKLIEGDIYYAPISPDYNILELIAPHFVERLSDQNWIIHDVKREIAVLYNKKDWIISDFQYDEFTNIAKEEIEYQKLWKGFFNTISILSRENPKLQKQLMPKRYWKHLTEKM